MRKTSRRTLLRRAIGGVAGAALWSASEATLQGAWCERGRRTAEAARANMVSAGPRQIPFADVGKLQVPAGVKIRGANHVLNMDHMDPQYYNDAWAGLWRVWDWPGWIQPQLDDIAKVGNAVRFWGNTLVLATDSISLSRYLAQWKQALDYIEALGLLVYPCGGDLAHWGRYTVDESVKCYSELASLLATYDNVIGVDVVNEPALFPWYQTKADSPPERLYRQSLPYDQFVRQLGAVLQSHGIPVAYSRSLRAADEWTQDASSLDAFGDFLDFHVYYSPGLADSLPIYDTLWGRGKKMIIGEFGMDLNASSDIRRAYYSAIRDLSINDPNCMGAFAWSAYDPRPTPDWGYGLFDQQRVLRNDIGQPFSTFPVSGSLGG